MCSLNALFPRKLVPFSTSSHFGGAATRSPSTCLSWSVLLLQVACAFYVAIAVLHSSCAILAAARVLSCPHSGTQPAPLSLCNVVFSSFSSRIIRSSGLRPVDQPDSSIPDLSRHSEDIVRWYTQTTVGQRNPPQKPFTMSASLFLSKAFQVSHEHLAYQNEANFDVVPYFYRSGSYFDARDITITTLVTRNRFRVFKELVERYRGPISVTVHVSRKELSDGQLTGGHAISFLDDLHELYSSTPLMSQFVDVHLVLTSSPVDRQFNTWRNVARLFARTDFVMMLDVDFVPCTDFRSRLKSIRGPVKELLDSGAAALVVPAFEYSDASAGANVSSFPRTKEALIELYNASSITMFHSSWAPGHNSTDYERFLYHSPPGTVYRIGQEAYTHAYEPYVILRREGNNNFPATLTWCDERFVGYGGNKAACLYEMYLSGVDFYVLADDFLVHRNHDYDEQARKLERRYNRRIYADFREEMCLKYLTFFRDAGRLEAPRARNVIHECKKVKGVSRLAAMVSYHRNAIIMTILKSVYTASRRILVVGNDIE